MVVDTITTMSVFFPASFVGIPCFVVGSMLFSLHMPVRGVVVDRRVHLGAKQQYRRRDVKVQEQREDGAQASLDNAVVGEVR